MLYVSADKGRDLEKTNQRGPDLELFVRDVHDPKGRRRRIAVKSWSTIKDVKNAIKQATHVPSSAQRLYFGPLLTSGTQLPNHRSLHDVGIYESGETLLMDIQGGGSNGGSSSTAMLADALVSPSSSAGAVAASYQARSELTNDVRLSSSVMTYAPRHMLQLIQQARRGFALGLKPEFVLDGSGGSYFLHDVRKIKVAVYKPADEEPYAENNPRGYLKQPGQPLSLREGIVPGEACIREVGAFMLDHGGFSGVPMTSLAEARHPAFNTNGARLKVSEGGASIGSHSISSLQSPSRATTSSSSSASIPLKVGSFQEFVRAECSMDDLSPSMISADEIHKIAILDIRIMNADRNSANLLCRRRPDNTIELVPIDHGFCLRSVADVSWMDWCWLDWPQLKEPLSRQSRKYILGLDIEGDARMLKDRLNLCQEALDIFRASSNLLKAGVKAGLTLYDIACMCCRNDNMGEIPSKLEVLFSMASELASSAVKNSRWDYETVTRALTDQLSPMGGSLFNVRDRKASSMRKSMSSLHISNFASLESSESIGIPDMVKSAASDSSLDSGDDDYDHPVDCKGWAAALVADVSSDKGSMLQTKPRSISIESEGSCDSGGFWQKVSPASDDEYSSADDDEDSITWSPSTSPTSSHLSKSFMFGDSLPRISFETRDSSLAPINKPPGKSKVSFSSDILPSKPVPSSPDRSNDAQTSSFGLNAKALLSPLLQRPDQGGMMRSKSFSALSSSSSTSNEKSAQPRDSRSDGTKQYRDYFLKFIDLVIVQETTAASRVTKGVI